MKDFEKCVDASRKPWYPKVKIAVLDTGVDVTHPNISSEIQSGRIKCHNFVDNATSVNDLDGHGTHCTSLIAKFAPNAEIYVGRVFRESEAAEDSVAIVTKVG
jgi:subtilisin family serine protease